MKTRNTVIGDLGMRDIRAGRGWHMARCAVGLRRMVSGFEVNAMAGQALRPIVRDPLFGRRLIVGIVTTRARHSVPGFLLADTLRHRLDLADSAQSALVRTCQYVVANVLGERLSGLEIIGVRPRPLDCDLPSR